MNLPPDASPKTQAPPSNRRNFILLGAVLVALGVACGLGLYTFIYAKGFSYISNDPNACANCHVMREVVYDWQRGDHHHVAVCNDCHVPQTPVAKWAVKALNGFHHSYAFTFLENPVTIEAGHLSQKIVQQNCERCHKDLLPNHQTQLKVGPFSAHQPEAPRCVQCHRLVGHIH